MANETAVCVDTAHGTANAKDCFVHEHGYLVLCP